MGIPEKEQMRQRELKGIPAKNFPKPMRNKKSIGRPYNLQAGFKTKY